MKAKTYNPYKIATETINRFRGVVNPENQQTISKEFVGFSSNMLCFRWGELTVRNGQTREAING